MINMRYGRDDELEADASGLRIAKAFLKASPSSRRLRLDAAA
jgi:hypothetical protein